MYNPNLSSLLLLPPPPTAPTPAALKAAYGPSITSAFTGLASLKLSKPAILEIALPLTRQLPLKAPRSSIFEEAERLLAGLYGLICIICAQNSIGLDDDGGVDPRVVLVTYNGSARLTSNYQSCSGLNSISGPIIDLEELALTRRNWNYIFSLDGKQGQEILNGYLRHAGDVSHQIQGEMCRVQGGTTPSSVIAAEPSNVSAVIHTTVAVGGTFDHLHAGHKLLLTATALLLQPCTTPSEAQRRLIIGITGDELLKNKKYAEHLQTWQQRQEDVVDFLLTILLFNPNGNDEVETLSHNEPSVNGRAVHTRLKEAKITIECVEIQDPFGPTITDESVTALVVSGETRSGGAAVNTKRQEKGWKPLEVFEVGVLDAQEKSAVSGTEEFASKISSTAIRKRKAEIAQKAAL